jgi:hypothetical protein
MPANQIFLSYARHNLEFARRLHDRVEATNIAVWWDQEELAGDDWTEQILAWIEDADAIVVIVSQHSAISPSVKNEILLAQDHRRRVIPVLLEQARGGLWVLIRSIQWIDARDGRDPIPDLLRALGHDAMQRGEATNALPIPEPEMQQHLLPPPASAIQARMTLVLPGEMRDFTVREQVSLRQILARFANINPDQIQIVRIEAGSIHVTLELPESTARWLMELYEQDAPLISLLDVQDIRNFQVLSADNTDSAVDEFISAPTLVGASPVAAPRRSSPGVDERLNDWLGHWARMFSLRPALAGALAAILLVVALGVFIWRGPNGGFIVEGNTTVVGVVADVQGTLTLQRRGWEQPIAVAAWTPLQDGDRLRVGDGSQATIVCADRTLTTLAPGGGGSLCNVADNTLVFAGGDMSVVRSAGNTVIPQVIAPRGTSTLSTTPTLRWTPVEGASAYTVALRQGQESVWSRTVTDTTTLVYPFDAPPLERDQAYRAVVTVDDGPEETTPGLGFIVLPEAEAQQLEANAQRVRELGLDPFTTELLLANFYAQNNLTAEAFAQLNRALTTARTNGDVRSEGVTLRTLGDLYATIGLPDQAIEPYQQALAAAQSQRDRLAEAHIYHALGEAYSVLGGADNQEQARENLRQALRLYEEIGDAQRVEAIRQRLDELA